MNTLTTAVPSTRALGSSATADGVHFGVWAPHADAACVVGDFNAWKRDALAMQRAEGGTWWAFVPAATPGQEYRFELRAGDHWLSRIYEMHVGTVGRAPTPRRPRRSPMRSACSIRVFVKEAHARGLGVILDVVYNHFGPDDLHLWRFDGWSEHDGGGICPRTPGSSCRRKSLTLPGVSG